MRNEKINIKKITEASTRAPKVQGQGCLDDCREWVGKTSSPSCRLSLTPKTSSLL